MELNTSFLEDIKVLHPCKPQTHFFHGPIFVLGFVTILLFLSTIQDTGGTKSVPPGFTQHFVDNNLEDQQQFINIVIQIFAPQLQYCSLIHVVQCRD